MQPERRYTRNNSGGAAVTVRNSGSSRTITGYGAVFWDGTAGTQFELMPGLMERIMPTAFDRALRERDDVRALFNHSPNIVLGRTTAGTLKLSVDSRGLRYSIDPPKTREDVIESIRRKDVTASSFAFLVEDENWTKEGRLEIREIHGAKLLDISPVTYPAYEGTSVELSPVRSQQKARARVRMRWAEVLLNH